jgi:hypothetical protein
LQTEWDSRPSRMTDIIGQSDEDGAELGACWRREEAGGVRSGCFRRRRRSGVGQQDVRDELDVDEGGLEHREDL